MKTVDRGSSAVLRFTHETAMESAGRLVEQRNRFANELEIVMRVYFEKAAAPRLLEGPLSTIPSWTQLQDNDPAHRAQLR